jgi:hypothetical protein
VEKNNHIGFDWLEQILTNNSTEKTNSLNLGNNSLVDWLQPCHNGTPSIEPSVPKLKLQCHLLVIEAAMSTLLGSLGNYIGTSMWF